VSCALRDAKNIRAHIRYDAFFEAIVSWTVLRHLWITCHAGQQADKYPINMKSEMLLIISYLIESGESIVKQVAQAAQQGSRATARRRARSEGTDIYIYIYIYGYDN
jgi:hypothetical protein